MVQNTGSFKPSILDVDIGNLTDLVTSWNEPSYRAKQIWDGLYKQLKGSPDEFSNLPGELKQKLQTAFDFTALEPVSELISRDRQTTKTLFSLRDNVYIESILMKYRHRNSVCISSQSGCALNCSFCATGQSGFGRDLTSGEIVEQVIWHARRLKNDNEKLTNVVIMGMGEPFLNFDNVLSAIHRLNHKEGFSLGKRRFTVSTAGIIPGINRFAREEDQVNLAISLHAANDKVRSTLMPINRKYPLSDLMAACRDYTDKTHRRVSFEWALIEGVNDRAADAQELISLLRGMLCHVNLILLNPTDKYRRNASSNDAAQQFKLALDNAHIPCTIRSRRGIDIQAGCGQLAGKVKSSSSA